MKSTNIISKIAIFAVFATGVSDYSNAAVRNKSRSYADAYNQVNAMANPYPNAASAVVDSEPVLATLPVRVANAGLANKIARGDTSVGVTVNDLERCSMIYPGGEFAWDTPTAGLGRGTNAKCVAVVELVAANAASNGSDLVLARANVASGDSVRCNISDFPEAGYTTAVSDFIFPADNPPTMEDVVQVLNAEQRQNAGFKIAASAVVGALAGNVIGKNDAGHDGLLGTSQEKIKGSVIGAAIGTAIGAGSAYSGKVGGDIIMSTSVNAAAGGVMGNVMATGDSVLRVEKCKLLDDSESTCLWGYINTGDTLETGKTAFYDIKDSITYVCTANGGSYTGCQKETLTNITLKEYADKSIQDAKAEGFVKVTNTPDAQYCIKIDENGTGKPTIEHSNDCNNGGSVLAMISSARKMGQLLPAMIPNVPDKAFGLKEKDWKTIKKNEHGEYKVVGRGTKGEETKLSSNSYSIDNFSPMYRSADDGEIVDFGNKARLKATATGAGAGAALGAFSAYQGAQSDINERWVTATREYEDSLTKVYCRTGSRYLTHYNENATILPLQ